jgi:hypothetical protein
MRAMFQVELVCSDPRCEAEMTLFVDELGEVDAIACECGHGLVTVRIEGFEPVVGADSEPGAEVIELRVKSAEPLRIAV